MKKNKKKDQKKPKQTAYELFLCDGLTFPDGSYSKIVFNYSDAMRIYNSNRKRGKKGKKTIRMFDRIDALSIKDVAERLRARVDTIKKEEKKQEKDEKKDTERA